MSTALSRVTLNTSRNSGAFITAVAATSGIILGVNTVFASSHESGNNLEQEFGTHDGYFPSATPGALLSKMPGNKDRLVGEHYVPSSLRSKYNTKRPFKMSDM